MLVEINKICLKTKKVAGKDVIDPHSMRKVQEIAIERELIKIEEIRSARPWNKSAEEEMSIEGGITILYLTGNIQKPAIEVRINEHFDDFIKRVPVIAYGSSK
jgi:hypothetical protein